MNRPSKEDIEIAMTPVVRSSLEFRWEDVVYEVPQRTPRGAKFGYSPFASGRREEQHAVKLLDRVSGSCQAGHLFAIMGPSGAGKSTLLDCLSARKQLSSGQISYDGNPVSESIRQLSSYVEQDDALLGSLSVRETFWFSARLSLPGAKAAEIHARVEATIQDLGLGAVAANRIGTPIQRGISGGQKRRVTIGNSLISLPPVLFLDEPTSGLDSATAFEVMTAIKRLAEKHSIAVVATIHSPSWETFQLFNKVLLLAKGKEIYNGLISEMPSYFAQLGYPVAEHANPADHVLKVASTDFSEKTDKSAQAKIEAFSRTWNRFKSQQQRLEGSSPQEDGFQQEPGEAQSKTARVRLQSRSQKRSLPQRFAQTLFLTQRNIMNYNRNLLAYGVRMGMYVGMGVMVATVWVRMPQKDRFINDRLSVHFFSVAFLGFMSVAGIPSFLEERSVLLREKRNGLYGAFPFVVANTLTNLPYLFVCSLLYAILVYWSINLHPGATHFFKFLAYLFLGVYAAEAQSLLIAAVLPIFVAALAVAAFANGFWMAVQGYFMRNLPDFWYYWAHWIDYETYAFQLLVKNDFKGLAFPCDTNADGTCACTFTSPASDGVCAVQGDDVIRELGYNGTSNVLFAFVLVIIIAVYRVGFWAALALRD